MRKTISSLHADFVTVKNKTVFNEISFRQSHILEAKCFVRCSASRRVMPRKIRFESVWRVKIVNSIGILRLRVGRAGLWSVRKRERLGILVNVKSNAVSREIWTLRKKMFITRGRLQKAHKLPFPRDDFSIYTEI